MRGSVRGVALSATALVGAACGLGARAADEVAIGVDGRPLAQERAASTRLARIELPDVAGRLLPGYRSELSGVALQRWALQGRAGIGIGVGSVTRVDRPAASLAARPGDRVGGEDVAVLNAASGTVLTLGLRYRTTASSSIYADAVRLRGLGLAADDRIVSKVGIEFKAAQSSWKIDYGDLGLRLPGDARMTVRLRRSGLAIGMRSTF